MCFAVSPTEQAHGKTRRQIWRPAERFPTHGQDLYRYRLDTEKAILVRLAEGMTHDEGQVIIGS